VIVILPRTDRLERDVDLVARPYGQKASVVTAIETPHPAGRTSWRLATGHPQCPDRCDGADLMPPGESKEQATHRETLHPKLEARRTVSRGAELLRANRHRWRELMVLVLVGSVAYSRADRPCGHDSPCNGLSVPRRLRT
jgi:hypothetical protein